jgi:hypothetical protein
VSESKKKFAPRVGFAFRPTDKWVIRAGYGLTNDPFSLARFFRTNYPILLVQNLQGANDFVPYTPQGIAAGIPVATVPGLGNGIIDIPATFASFTVDKNFRRGYIQSWNFTVQRQLPGGFIGQAGYVATRSTAQMGWIDINAGQVIGLGAAGRPLQQQFGRSSSTQKQVAFGTNMYDSLQATLEKRFSSGVQFNMAYTWSKVLGYQDNNDSGPAVAAIPYFSRNRVARGYNIPHNLQISSVFELPFGRGKNLATGGPLAAILGGWQVNGVASFFSGSPFSVNSNGASLNMPGSNQTADQVVAEVRKLGGVGRGTPFYDPDAFVPVTAARFGNTSENILYGPGIVNIDAGIFRSFQLGERFKLQFRGEAFNVANTPQFNNPGNNVSSYNPTQTNLLTRYGGYMEVTSTRSLGRDGYSERQFRLGLRLSF